MPKPKIFLTCYTLPEGVVGGALAEDGVGLAHHLSSHKLWCSKDMTTQYKLAIYAEHYPDGYDLINLIHSTDEELLARKDYMDAMKLNNLEDPELGQSLHDEGGPTSEV